MTISGRVLPKACPTREGAEKKQKPNPNIKVNYVTFGLPEDFHSDAEFPIFYVPWRGFGEGPLLFWDFIPGDLPMWIVLLPCFCANTGTFYSITQTEGISTRF
jgi:hypothetical protein